MNVQEFSWINHLGRELFEFMAVHELGWKFMNVLFVV